MKESSFVSKFSTDLEKKAGGKMYKLADRASLGRPDSFHLKSGLVTFIEFKVEERVEWAAGNSWVQPFKTIRKDLRQYEICREISKNALVLFVIYYPRIKYSAVLTVDQMVSLRCDKEEDAFGIHEDKWLNPKALLQGFGIPKVISHMNDYKEKLIEKLRVNG